MNQEQKIIIKLITEYLEKYPQVRFGQALFNLGILDSFPSNTTRPQIRDIYNDSDKEILQRIKF